ncbi:MAG: hypothetical protein AAB656_03890 [Patescibacteria group bacterium]
MKKLLTSVPYNNIVIPALGVNFVVLLLVIVLQNNLPPVVPLYYGLPTGEEELAKKIFLTVPSLVSILIILVNVVFMKRAKDSFLPKVLLGLIIGSTILGAITTIKIILLVGSF